MKKVLILSLCCLFAFASDLSAGDRKAEKIGRKAVSSFQSVSGRLPQRTTHPSSMPDTSTIFFDDLESGTSDWTLQGKWSLSTETASSPTHSFHHKVGTDEKDTLFSPIIKLPDIIEELETFYFSFSVWAEMLDSDGDGDNSLEDYYRLWLKDLDSSTRGYSNEWVDYLDTPDITVTGGDFKLTFKLLYRLESKEGLPHDDNGCQVNGWDAANVQISTNGGTSWTTLKGTPTYNCSSCFGFRYNLNECDVSGWTDAIDDWVDAEFDLSDYSGDTVRVRFAFASDPGWSTADDPTQYRSGVYIDEVLVANSSDTLFYDNADDKVELQPVGSSHWNRNEYNGHESTKSWWSGAELNATSYNVTYDYGTDGRPGTLGWEVYGPGSAFNEDTNYMLNLSEYAGRRVRIGWEFISDDNHDGDPGNTSMGLYIDDLHVWKKSLAESAPVPTGLSASTGGGIVDLTWNEVSTGDLVGEVFYDDNSFEDAIFMTGGTGICGTVFEMPFGSSTTVTKVKVISPDEVSTATIYGYEVKGGEPAAEPTYDTTMARELDVWSEIELDWQFKGDFLIGQQIDSLRRVAVDADAVPSEHSWTKIGSGSWQTWRNIATSNNLTDGEWGIRAEVTASGGADAVYNVYRHGPGESFSEPLPDALYLKETSFSDSLVLVGVDYTYAVTSIFNVGTDEETESGFSSTVLVRPRSDTVREVAYDDGTSETGATSLGENGWYAVHFQSNIFPITLMMLKYHARKSGGLTYLVIFDDDGEDGLPGNHIGATLIFPTVNQGWNIKDVSGAGLTITEGDYYVGWGETPDSPPLSIDTDSDPRDHSYFYTETDGWGPISDLGYKGDLLIRTAVDIEGADVEEKIGLPEQFSLSQNMPNPFNPETLIKFDVAKEGRVFIRLFDIRGREVSILHDNHIPPGSYTYFLDGRQLASGVYFYRMEAAGFTATKKLLLVR
ncbi:MAG: T9SS type A sorting domain-containing protein [Candidatus Neomarinimicrobiota bacterium]|nr:T9SS type A sorting domain-containing protein [Candidatus Neomarinimicrobiota bacterium]